MAMEAALGSSANGGEVIEVLDIVEATGFELLLSDWRRTSKKSFDYRPGRTWLGADYVYYDQFELAKTTEDTTRAVV